jgi:hypothetical protein
MRLHIPVLALGITFGAAVPAWSQTAPPRTPIARVDLTGIAGWLSADKAELQRYDDWYTSGSAGGSVGWYWTDHLKTELEYAGSAKIERDVYSYEQVGPLQITRESTYHFSTRRFAIGQHYQFYRNVAFHPYVAAGIDLNWESTDREDRQERIFDTVSRQTLPGALPERHPRRTDVHARPFGTVGFKAYMSPRAFFRSDLKFVVDSGVEEVLFRFGFGVDF